MKKWFAVIAVVMILGLVFGATQVYASTGSASGLAQPVLKKTPPPSGQHGNNPGIDKKATQQAERDLRQAEQQLEKGNQHGKKLSFRGTVKEVGDASFILTVGSTDMTFMVDEKTQFKIPTLGRNALLADLNVGVQASVRAVELAPETEVSPEAAPAVEAPPAASMLALSVQVIPGKPVKIHRVGIVTAYTAGVTITIQAKDAQQYTFLLSETTKILPAERAADLKVGSFVTIISRRDVTGGPLSAQGIVVHPAVPGGQEGENVNPPTDITLTPSTVAENAPVGTTVGTLSALSPKPGATFTFTLVAGTGDTNNASFTIVGNLLNTTASFDFETTPTLSILVKVTDQDGSFFEKALTITVTDVATELAPTAIVLTPLTLANASPVGTVVGVFTTTDPDLGDKVFTYTLVAGTGDTDNAAFTINGDQLVTTFVADAVTKNTYSVRVRSTDTSGLFFEQQFTITVNP